MKIALSLVLGFSLLACARSESDGRVRVQPDPPGTATTTARGPSTGTPIPPLSMKLVEITPAEMAQWLPVPPDAKVVRGPVSTSIGHAELVLCIDATDQAAAAARIRPGLEKAGWGIQLQEQKNDVISGDDKLLIRGSGYPQRLHGTIVKGGACGNAFEVALSVMKGHETH